MALSGFAAPRGALERPVLVIEDNHDDFEVIERVVARCGFTNPLHRLVIGSDAVEYLSRSAGHQKHLGEPLPALIMLDLRLPAIDGKDVLSAIKSEPKYRHIPVVVMSTSKNPSDVLACYEAGANSYLYKAVQFEEFSAAVSTVLQYWLTLAEIPARD